MDQLFGLCNLFAMGGWLLLALAPRWRGTERLVMSGAWSLALSVVYLLLMLVYGPEGEGGFGSIADVRALFGHDAILTAGWVHYLAFDLYVGAIELRLGQASGIPHLLMIPILLATFMLGPVGLVLFFITRAIYERRLVEVTR